MEYVIFAIIAYLLGSIPSALIVGKLGYKIDIREHGSGNLGATNTFRVLGIKAGIIVTVSDVLKGTIATLLPLIMGADVHQLIIGLFAVVGHTYPLFAKLKGGKAVATSGGIILGVSPLLFLSAVVVFIITLYISKYVSLSSIITGVATVVAAILLNESLELIIVTCAIAIFVSYRHKTNIKRIQKGTEPKITWM